MFVGDKFVFKLPSNYIDTHVNIYNIHKLIKYYKFGF